MKNIITSAGGRKFIYGVLITLGFFTLAIVGKISYQELLTAVEWIFGIFVVGNVAQKFSSTKTDV